MEVASQAMKAEKDQLEATLEKQMKRIQKLQESEQALKQHVASLSSFDKSFLVMY